MEKVNVSVIVPVYNVEKYLDKCLNSLVNQDFDNYEIIIVNDGSPDNSETIINKYEKKYKDKVRSYKKKNGGISSARNFGLEKSTGSYLMFVDSDDYVATNYISSLYNEAISNDYDIVMCDVIKKFEDKEEILHAMNCNDKNTINNYLLSLPATWNKIYKKSLFNDNGIIYPVGVNCGEDLTTTVRLLINTKNIGYINKPLYYYVQRDNSIMNQKKYNPKNFDVFTSLNILVKYFKDKRFYDDYVEEIEYLHISHLLHDFTLRVYKYEEGKEDIKNVILFMKNNYPNWRKNKYYKKESLKYKIVCLLIYYNKISILRRIIK